MKLRTMVYCILFIPNMLWVWGMSLIIEYISTGPFLLVNWHPGLELILMGFVTWYGLSKEISQKIDKAIIKNEEGERIIEQDNEPITLSIKLRLAFLNIQAGLALYSFVLSAIADDALFTWKYIIGGTALGLVMVVVENRFLQKMVEMAAMEEKGITE